MYVHVHRVTLLYAAYIRCTDLCGVEGGQEVLVDVPGVREAGEGLDCLYFSAGSLLHLVAVHCLPLLALPLRVLRPHKPSV